MFLLSLNAHLVAFFEVNITSLNNYLRIADNLVSRSILVLMGNVLESMYLISSKHLVLDRVSHALLTACTIFEVELLYSNNPEFIVALVAFSKSRPGNPSCKCRTP